MHRLALILVAMSLAAAAASLRAQDTPPPAPPTVAAPAPAADADAPASAPAPAPAPAEPATPPAPDPAPSAAAPLTPSQLMLKQLEASLAAPPTDPSPAAARQHLQRVLEEAAQLAARSDEPAIKHQAFSVQMQALYGLLQRFPRDGESSRWLTNLRALARRTKALPDSDAEVTADFWLMTAELVEIHRADLSASEKQQQIRTALRQFTESHPGKPATAAARIALARLAALPAPKVESKPDASPAAAPAAAPTSGGGLEPADPPVVDGVLHFRLASPHQPEANLVRVLLPEKLRADPAKLSSDEGYRLLFMLPVEAKLESRYGDPIAVAKQLNLADRHDLIIIAPTFAQLPWYADHAADKHVAQQKFVIESLVPAVDKQYRMAHPRRLLLGFSKSGWGAVSLLLARPDLFDAAGIFDAPLTVDAPTKYGMGPIFGSPENFTRYELTARVRAAAESLRARPRIALIGYGNFQQPMQQFHELLQELLIPHESDLTTRFDHTWSSGWLQPTVDALLKLTE